MATYTLDKLGLVEIANRLAPDGTMQPIADVIANKSPLIKDMKWVESNDLTRHKTTRKASKGQSYARRLYEGVPKTTIKTVPLWDKIGVEEMQENVDIEYVKTEMGKGVDKNTVLNQELTGLSSDMGESIESKLFYTDGASDEDRPTGIKPRLDDLSIDTVISNGGSTADSCTSVYVLTHDPKYFHGIFQKGSPAGLERYVSDLIPNLDDGNGKEYQGYKLILKWRWGCVLVDPRGAGRLCNIDDVTTFDETKLGDVLNEMDVNENTRIYVNRRLRGQIKKRANTKSSDIIRYNATKDERLGLGPVYEFEGVRIMFSENILDTEAVVS